MGLSGLQILRVQNRSNRVSDSVNWGSSNAKEESTMGPEI